MKHRTLSLAALLLTAGCLLADAPPPVDPLAVTEARTFDASGGVKLLYRLLKPANYDPKVAYPLVIFLHGSGGSGSDNRQQIADQPVALQMLANEPLRSKFPCFVLAPQAPKGRGGGWTSREVFRSGSLGVVPPPSPAMGAVLELLPVLAKEFHLDPCRYYVTGLSMGGYGTWDLLVRCPGRFAAAMPICGGYDPGLLLGVGQVPLHIFHGSADPAVPVQRARDAVEALAHIGNIPYYTEYPGVGHDSWHKAYATPLIWDWLFAQRLGQRPEPSAAKARAFVGLG